MEWRRPRISRDSAAKARMLPPVQYGTSYSKRVAYIMMSQSWKAPGETTGEGTCYCITTRSRPTIAVACVGALRRSRWGARDLFLAEPLSQRGIAAGNSVHPCTPEGGVKGAAIGDQHYWNLSPKGTPESRSRVSAPGSVRQLNLPEPGMGVRRAFPSVHWTHDVGFALLGPLVGRCLVTHPPELPQTRGTGSTGSSTHPSHRLRPSHMDAAESSHIALPAAPPEEK